MIDLSQMKADELEQLKATIDAEVESRHSKLMDELDELLKNIKQLRMKHLHQLLMTNLFDPLQCQGWRTLETKK